MVNFFIERKKHTAKYYSEVLSNDIELEMVLIPEGEFMMGAPETELESRNSERPQYKVNVPTFFMGRYPITQEQWQAIMGNNPSEFKGDKRPVERVSWDEAQEFCDRLSKKTGRKYRLPTEAEWEYACRSGTNTPFHYGETITTELANYNGESTYGERIKGIRGEYRKQTTPVGEFSPNEFGLCDMHGNVWEWCEDDWHDNYENAPNDGAAWLSRASSNKVVRGGSWLTYPVSCRSAYRGTDARVSRGKFIGFRVVCVVSVTT